jgi:hypothetical protein
MASWVIATQPYLIQNIVSPVIRDEEQDEPRRGLADEHVADLAGCGQQKCGTIYDTSYAGTAPAIDHETVAIAAGYPYY